MNRQVTLLTVLALALSGPPVLARPRITLYLEGAPQQSPALRALHDALERALAARTDVAFIPLEALLEPPLGFQQRVREGERARALGRAQLERLEVTTAITTLERAVRIQEELFHWLDRRPGWRKEHVSLLGDLALALFLAGQTDRCKVHLRRSFILERPASFDPIKFPPQMKHVFASALFLTDALAQGNVAIQTTPPGATIRANGQLVGISPVVARGLAPGRNVFSASLPGWRSRSVTQMVVGGQEASLHLDLPALPGAPGSRLRQALDEAPADGGARLAAVARQLGTRILLAGRTVVEGSVLTLDLHRGDAEGGREHRRMKHRFPLAPADAEVQTLLTSLLTAPPRRADPAAPLVAARPPERPPRDSWLTRFRRSPCFWYVVGGVAGAVVVGTGITIGAVYGTRHSGDRDRRFLILY